MESIKAIEKRAIASKEKAIEAKKGCVRPWFIHLKQSKNFSIKGNE